MTLAASCPQAAPPSGAAKDTLTCVFAGGVVTCPRALLSRRDVARACREGIEK